MLAIIQAEIRQQLVDQYHLAQDVKFDELLEQYPDEIKNLGQQYFLDYDHYNLLGHQLVSEWIGKAMKQPETINSNSAGTAKKSRGS